MLSVMIMALTQMQHGSMVIGFTQQATQYSPPGHRPQKRSPPDDVGRWVITWSRGLTRKGIEKISRSVRVQVYLVLTSQVQVRSSLVGNSASAVDAQEVFESTFKALIDEDYSISNDIQRY